MRLIGATVRQLWLATLALIAVAALLVGATRYLLLPHIDHFRPDLESWLGGQTGRPVAIDSIAIEWHDLWPTLRLDRIGIGGGSGAATLELDALWLTLDLHTLITRGQLQLGELALRGLALDLTLAESGQLLLNGVRSSSGEVPGELPGELLDWLFRQPRIDLLSSRIRLHRSDQPPLLLDGVDLTLTNGPERHQLALNMGSGPLGGKLQLIADLHGVIATPEQLSGRLYLAGQRLDLAALSQLAGQLLPQLVAPLERIAASGNPSLKLWLDLEVGVIERVNLELEAVDLAIAPYHWREATGRVLWQRIGGGWRLNGEGVKLVGTHHQLDLEQFEVGKQADGEGDRWLINIPSIDAAAAGSVLGRVLEPAQLEWLEQLQPTGRVRQARAVVRRSRDGELAVEQLEARLDRWGQQAVGRLPGLQQLDAALTWQAGRGAIELFSDGLVVDLPDLFREPLHASRAEGRLAIEWRDDRWQLSSDRIVLRNSDLSTVSRLILNGSRNGVDWIDMRSDFVNGRVAGAWRYLPVGIMPPPVVEWLDRALRNGRVTDGSLLVHGAPRDFPFDHGRGRFLVDFNVAQSTLDYYPQWPPLKQLDARILFDGRSFSAEGQGLIRDGKVAPVRAAIDDLLAPLLTIDGTAVADGSDLLAILRETPLKDGVGSYFEGMSLAGSHSLELALRLPLSSHGEKSTSGRLLLTDGLLDSGVPSIRLERLNGTVAFDADGIEADGVTARLMGGDLTLAARPADGGGSRLTAEAEMPLQPLVRQYLPLLAPHLSGSSHFDLELTIPGRSAVGRLQPLRLQLQSDLAGSILALPPPLAREGSEPLPLSLDLAFSQQETRGQFQLGDQLAGRLRLPAAAGEPGAYAFGLARVAPELPAEGVVVEGRIEQFDLLAWHALLPQGEGEPTTLPVDAAIEVDRLHLGDFLFQAQKIALHRFGGLREIGFSGRDASGELRIYSRPGHRIEGHFDRLYLNRPHRRQAESDAPPAKPLPSSPIDPRRLPAVTLSIDRFGHDGQLYGDFAIEGAADRGGWHFSANGTLPSASYRADGEWLWSGGRPATHIELQLDTAAIDQQIALLGYPHTLTGGSGTLGTSLSWPGGPEEFDLLRLDGRLELDLANLRILEIDPGLGRILGLLRLDLTGAIGKGIAFDRATGRLRFAGGQVSDEVPLQLSGNTAALQISGNTDLADKNYDLLIDVTPHFSASLPLAGAIAGGPLVGAAILVAERLLDGRLDRIARHHYHVSGDWLSPQVELVSGDSLQALLDAQKTRTENPLRIERP
jgi:uncharacterized protein (TIGR02099 family)